MVLAGMLQRIRLLHELDCKDATQGRAKVDTLSGHTFLVGFSFPLLLPISKQLLATDKKICPCRLEGEDCHKKSCRLFLHTLAYTFPFCCIALYVERALARLFAQCLSRGRQKNRLILFVILHLYIKTG